MAFQWRRFQFFDKEQLTDHEQRNSALLFSADGFGQPVCSTTGRGQLAFANVSGMIRVVSRDMEVMEWAAHQGEIIGLYLLKRSRNILVSIGDDNAVPQCKFWLVDPENGTSSGTSTPNSMNGKGETSTSSNTPTNLRTLPIFSQKFPQTPITCFSVLEDLSQMAIGMANGSILLFEGNLLKDRSPKQSIIQQEEVGRGITGLYFSENEGRTSSKDASTSDAALTSAAGAYASPALFVVTAASVSTIFTKHPKHLRLDIDNEGGADPLCSTITPDQRLVVARKEAVYFYNPEERGVCFGFEGQKKMIAWYHNYLVVVSEAAKDSNSVTMSGSRDSLTIYDLRQKCIAFQSRYDSILAVLPSFSALYVLNNSAMVTKCIEKDLSSKMEMLFKKNLYPIAISLAMASGDRALVHEIYTQYGDHLYSKGDYEGAMQQYMETVGYTEPSYVIRKFLDAQRIHQLTSYLERLHEKNRANRDHTTLLLNCYTKLKNVQMLETFIKSNTNASFDVNTAIQVCRTAGYTDHALYLARQYNDHENVLLILMEDCQQYHEALTYIASLQWADADRFCIQYGKRLMEELPHATTLLFLDLCLNWVPKPISKPTSSKLSYPSPLTAASASSAANSIVPSTSSSPSTHKSNPENFIHFFVDRPNNLQTFLERIIEEPNASPLVYNTLLELYLRQKEVSPAGEISHPFQGSIMSLLKASNSNYNVEHALILCQLHNFEKGTLYLYSRLHLYNEIVAHHIAHHQHSKIIKACKKYSLSMPNVWLQALSYFASTEDVSADEITIIVENIEKLHLLPPLLVVRTLAQGTATPMATPNAQNPVKPLAVIKDYLLRTLKSEQSILVKDEEEIARYTHDTALMREEISKLQCQPITFQAIKCHACGLALTLPAIHFLCIHSYHQRCIAENETECPKCAPEYRKVCEIKKRLNASANQHDRFFAQLDDSTDGFATVAEYFGKGIFDPQDSTEEPRE